MAKNVSSLSSTVGAREGMLDLKGRLGFPYLYLYLYLSFTSSITFL